VYLRTEKPHCAMNALHVVVWAFVMNCENQAIILLIFHKLAICNDIMNSKQNRIVGGNLVLRAIPCRVCFWPATTERLPTPALYCSFFYSINYFFVLGVFDLFGPHRISSVRIDPLPCVHRHALFICNFTSPSSLFVFLSVPIFSTVIF